jgi:hypothetical protein
MTSLFGIDDCSGLWEVRNGRRRHLEYVACKNSLVEVGMFGKCALSFRGNAGTLAEHKRWRLNPGFTRVYSHHASSPVHSEVFTTCSIFRIWCDCLFLVVNE